MRISRHHSQTTRSLNAALKNLRAAQALLSEARGYLTEAGGGLVPAALDDGTFNPLFELTRGRDADGETDPDGKGVIDRLTEMLAASVEQDNAARA